MRDKTSYNGSVQKTEKKPKFNFDDMKVAAMSPNAEVRKKVFEEYFERFEEFPSYLFDNENGIDSRLSQTIQDLKNDPETTEKMQRGLTLLLDRLPSHPEFR